jgi:hypothetical protein
MHIFYMVDQLALFGALVVAFLLVLEVGFWIGRHNSLKADTSTHEHVSSLQSALLGLLALLLGFTFAMSISRYDTRKELVLAEANAIGTTYLRAALQPEPERSDIQALLRAYVDARLSFHVADQRPGQPVDAEVMAVQLQAKLWKLAGQLTARDPHSIQTGLFVQSLNEVIDLREKRIRALENHVPDPVLFMVLLVALVAFGFVGQGRGMAGRRNAISTGLVAVLFALAMAIIVDIDRPRQGLIKVSQSSMLALKQSLQAAMP